MAFLTFIARHKVSGVYKLVGPVTVGRSMDCDIYVPDVFVSRCHCRFEKHNGMWRVVNMESRNGLWCGGKREDSFVLKPGDTIEIGTVAMCFNEGVPEKASNPAPYGMGLGVTELMDTLYAEDVHPSQYTKKQASRKSEWLARVQSQVARLEQETGDVEPVVDMFPWLREEWAELDMEFQISEGQEQMADWEPPIFNPKRKVLAAALEAHRDRDTADYKVGATMTAMKAEGASRLDSIDEEVEALVGKAAAGSAGSAAKRGGGAVASGMSAWSPVKKGKEPAAKEKLDDGIEIQEYTWRDRLMDTIREKWTTAFEFAKLNPAMAGAVVLGVVVVLVAVLKFSPVGQHSGPHLAPPRAAVVEK